MNNNANLSDIELKTNARSDNPFNDLRAWGMATPASREIYNVLTALAVTHGRTIDVDAVRNKTTRNNHSIKIALGRLERAGVLTWDRVSNCVSLVY